MGLADMKEVQLWTYNGDLTFVRRFKGHDQSRFLIRSCFGAAKDKFILSGSEGWYSAHQADTRLQRLRVASTFRRASRGARRAYRYGQRCRVEF